MVVSIRGRGREELQCRWDEVAPNNSNKIEKRTRLFEFRLKREAQCSKFLSFIRHLSSDETQTRVYQLPTRFGPPTTLKPDTNTNEDWDDDRLEKMPAATASASSLVENLGKTLPPHFQQAQLTLANHRKNIVSLHRLHASCATLTQDTPKGTKLVGEKAFNDVFLACLNRVLGIKRGVANADRTIKFVAGYCTCELPFSLFRLQKNR